MTKNNGSITQKFFKIGVLGLVACTMALGLGGAALAGDSSPQEREWVEEFRNEPSHEIVWTSEQLQEGARNAYDRQLNHEK